jgi:hypothetical protein
MQTARSELAELREELSEAIDALRLSEAEHKARLQAGPSTFEDVCNSRRRVNQAELRVLRAEHEFEAFVGARLCESASNSKSRVNWPTQVPARLSHYLFRWTAARSYLRRTASPKSEGAGETAKYAKYAKEEGRAPA